MRNIARIAHIGRKSSIANSGRRRRIADFGMRRRTTGTGELGDAPAVPLVNSSGEIIGEVRGGDSDDGATLLVDAQGLAARRARNPHPRDRHLRGAELRKRRPALEPDQQAAWRAQPARPAYGRPRERHRRRRRAPSGAGRRPRHLSEVRGPRREARSAPDPRCQRSGDRHPRPAGRLSHRPQRQRRREDRLRGSREIPRPERWSLRTATTRRRTRSTRWRQRGAMPRTTRPRTRRPETGSSSTWTFRTPNRAASA
jgi:hypothetical protein